MKTILKYPGGKTRIAPWICSYIPEHEVYVEPYFGGGAVFFNKQPAKIETINDINSDVYNYFMVLREYPEELIRKLQLTPFSREEYEKAYIINEQDDKIELARKFAVKCWMGFGCSNLYKNGFRSSQQSRSPETTKDWNSLGERIIAANKRLKHAQIEHLPATELIKRYGTKDVFMYLDPPYLFGTRKKYLYKHEMTDEEHVDLLELVVKHPGRFLISTYDNEIYEFYLKGWKKVSKEVTAEAGVKRKETLYMNYEISMTIEDYLNMIGG